MKEIVVVIVKYLKGELANNKLNPDAAEGVEVAVQCLENAYSITPEDVEGCSLALETLCPVQPKPPEASSYDDGIVTEEKKEEAENLKLTGNQLMKEARYKEAIQHYSRAILLDSKNSVYFCNRAAAYIQTKNYLAAINDCHESIRLDPNYSKAFSRLGYAWQAVGNRIKARDAYARAIDLEPENETYKSCYHKLLDFPPGDPRPVSELMGLLPGVDLSSIMKNPSFVQMASQMLEDPSMQNAVSRILTGQSSFPLGQVEELISAGQRVADRLQNRIDTQQQQAEGSSSAPQPSCCDNGRPMEQQEVTGSQEPTASTAGRPQQTNIPTPGPESAISPESGVGASGERPSSTGAHVNEGPIGMDMGDGGDNAKEQQ